MDTSRLEQAASDLLAVKLAQAAKVNEQIRILTETFYKLSLPTFKVEGSDGSEYTWNSDYEKIMYKLPEELLPIFLAGANLNIRSRALPYLHHLLEKAIAITKSETDEFGNE